MADLPYTRVVNVTLTRNDNFPTRVGFGTPLVVSEIASDITAGAVDAATIVKTYGSLPEVQEDWGPSTGAYLAAAAIFGQSPRPLQIKIGFIDDATLAADYPTEFAKLIEFDNGWYMALMSSTGSWTDDAPKCTSLAQYFTTLFKQCFVMSYDANTESQADTTSVAAVVKLLNIRRFSVFYHDIPGTQLHAATAAYMGTRNYDTVDSHYTMKFKNFNGVPVVDKGSSAVQAITGFVPGLGLDAAQGHYANTYVDIGGADFLVEGSASDGTFIDSIHFEDWIIARTQEQTLEVFTTNAVIPYTDIGFDMIVQGVRNVMMRAINAGAIAPFTDVDGTLRQFALEVAKVASVPVAQRAQRIMPPVKAKFRYAGAVHWTEVNYEMNF